MRILGIETSCDETAAAVVENGTTILSSAVASSTHMHEKYGGIVPEIAAREQLKCIIPIIDEALIPVGMDGIDAIAVTVGPGLIGSLLVGVETAKTIAFATGKPLLPVNHVLAHMYANFIGNPQIQFPAISLVVSGGHTELYLVKNERNLTWLGGTFDDAAGEAFDKGARLLGFGHGGGPAIAKAATSITPDLLSKNHIKLPRPMLDHANALNFSFSGLKTAMLRAVSQLTDTNTLAPQKKTELAYELEDTITDVLVKKTVSAAQKYGVSTILLSGGVSANTKLREKFQTVIASSDITLYVPPPSLCTDNAVYIASYGYFRSKETNWHEVTATPDLSVEV